MSDQQHRKHFLKMPKYPGGSKAFKEFITENLCYPDAALEARVVGSVLVEYDIHDTGAVSNVRVVKGIGYGCDEEAVRLVKLLQFEKVKNRGVRVKLSFKTTIHFRLPNVSTNLAVSYTMEQAKSISEPEKKREEPVVYNYTIQL